MTGTIQTGIDLLPATGAMVQCLDGTYNIATGLVLDSYQTLKGCGRNTIFTTSISNLNFITATGSDGSEKTGITISDIQIYGGASKVANIGIVFLYVDYSVIQNVYSQSLRGGLGSAGFGLDIDHSDYNVITNNYCYNHGVGIGLYDAVGCIVTGNVCYENSSGIIVYTSADNCVASNVCTANTSYGIYVEGDNNALISNTCNNNTNDSNAGDGINATGSYCTYIGNVCRGNGVYGIVLTDSSHNLIEGNNVIENSQITTNTYDDINIGGNSDYNFIQGNLCRAGGETNKPRYGINIVAATCNGNKVINNDLYDDGFGTAPYNDDGTGTIYVEPGIDDTPVNGETGQPISSNWAYDHAATKSANATLGHVIVETASKVDVDGDGKLTLGSDVLLEADLENPPVENEAAKAPTSEWAFDHDAATTGVHGVGAGSIIPATTASVTLYVDAGSGSDGNAGTSGSPKATIQGALDALPVVIVHACTICVRGQQDYAESNTALDFSRFSTLTAITIKTVNSSDEDMYDNGVADAGAGNNELDDATKSWSVDQFNGAYVWVVNGTGEGQIREISDTTATKLTVTVNWTTNPDATSYYAIGGGAMMTGSGANHVLNIGKLVNVYGFGHENATSVDVRIEKSAVSNIGYNYFKTSVNGMFATWLAIIEGPNPQYNYSAATGFCAGLSALSYGVIRANVITGAAKGIRVYYASLASCSIGASSKNHIFNCIIGISVESGSGCVAASVQSFGTGAPPAEQAVNTGANLDPVPSTTIPEWYT